VRQAYEPARIRVLARGAHSKTSHHQLAAGGDEEIMHHLADMRIVEFAWALDARRSEVDANGQATMVVREVMDHDVGPPQGETFRAAYVCNACDEQFASWEEAKLHIIDLDQQDK
jgi:hypothetical protein